MPHAGGGGHSGGGHGGGSHSSSSGSGSSTPHYTKSFHPVCGYLIHGHYYDATVRPDRSGIVFAIIWTILSCIPLSIGVVGLIKHEASYDEDTFFSHSMAKYEEAFGASSPDYEDHIVTVFAMDKSKDEYHYYSIVGDNIKYNVDVLFGNNSSTLGTMLDAYVPRDYSVNFDDALEITVSKMKDVIVALGNASNFRSTTVATQQNGKVVNRATCFTSFTDATVDSALADFQASTGIGYTIVIEDFSSVFDFNVTDTLMVLGVGLLFVGIGVWFLISTVRTLMEIKEATAGGTSSRYYYDERKTNVDNGQDGFHKPIDK